MRKLLIPTLAFFAYVIPALAQDAPKQAVSKDEPKQTQTEDAQAQTKDTQKQAESQKPQKQTQDAPKQKGTAPTVAQNQDDALVRGTRAIEQSVQARLGLAGYTDIQMLPTSFLVRAKDRDGNSVTLVLGPESMTQSNDAAPEQEGGNDD
jgi:DNA-nicking Smr family endonuclease